MLFALFGFSAVLAETLLFADVDDTLKSGGGGTATNKIAGVEPAYHHSHGGALYPGMPTLLFEMSKHLNGNPNDEDVPKVNFLTARPCGTQSSLQSAMITASGHPDWGHDRDYVGGGEADGSCCDVLTSCIVSWPNWFTLNGNIWDNNPFFTETRYRNYGDRKAQGLEDLAEEKDFAGHGTRIYFFGDNGQGDVHAANRLNGDLRDDGVFKMAFIHDITDACAANGVGSPQWFTADRGTNNFVYYTNVIDLMANGSFQREIGLSSSAVARVTAAFRRDLANKGSGTAMESSQYRQDIQDAQRSAVATHALHVLEFAK